jgi:hypothetical protein
MVATIPGCPSAPAGRLSLTVLIDRAQQVQRSLMA